MSIFPMFGHWEYFFRGIVNLVVKIVDNISCLVYTNINNKKPRKNGEKSK